MPQVSITYPTAGSFTWIAPSDVSSVQVELIGGGGAGGGSTVNNDGGGGGAGGQYSVKQVTVTPSTTHTVVVSAGKTGTTGTAGAGADSTFDSTTVVAKGGAGGVTNNGAGGVGSTASGVGDTVFAGGSGSAGAVSTRSGGGGGAGSAAGTGGSTTASTTGGTSTSPGGAGGAGLAAGANAAGSNGSIAGGGGGGGYRTVTTSRAGGNGAIGWAKLTFTTSDPALTGLGGNLTGATASQTNSVVIDNVNSTLVVAIQAFDTTAANTLISSVKFNGVNLTQLQALPAHGAVFPNNSVYLYAITGLTPQTANLVITWAGVCAGPESTWVVYANTAATVDNSSIAETDAAVTFTGSLTTIANNALCWSFVSFNNNSSSNPSGADQVQTFLITNGFNAASTSKTAKTPAGSVTHTYTNTTPDDYIMVMASITPPPPIGKDISPGNNTPGMVARQAVNRAGTY